MLLGESFLLAFSGGIPALACSWAVLQFLNQALVGFLPTMVLSVEVILMALMYMVILALATGFLPARNAIRIKIVAAFSRG